MENNYFVYHLHSSFSLLDSATNYRDYVDKAKELGQKALAFSEHGNIYNFIEKKMYCEQNGIKYVHACEVYLTNKLCYDDINGSKYKIRDNFHTVLIAKNIQGFLELNSLISKSNSEDHFYFKPRISVEEFLNISDNVIKISACLASPLNLSNIESLKNRLNEKLNIFIGEFEKESDKDKKEQIHKVIEKTKNEIKEIDSRIEDIFKKYDYYEIQYHVNSESQKKYNKFLLDMSKRYNKPLIAGTDTHSINKYKEECRSILQKGKGIEFAEEDTFDLTYKTYEELKECFKKQGVLPEEVYLDAINNTNILCESIEELKLDYSIKYPVMSDNDVETFTSRVYSMFEEKVTNGVIPQDEVEEYKRDIEEELRVFKKVNMCGFMLSMSDICMFARNNNHPLGPARGSCGGSRCAYVTDIIDLDPVKWGTVFSRFCNEDRVEIGD